MNFETIYGLSLIAVAAAGLTGIIHIRNAGKRRAAAARNARRREYDLRCLTRN